MDFEFLVATNGFEGTWPSIEYGAWSASLIGAPLTLLGIVEHLPSAPLDDRFPLEDLFGRAVDLFRERGLSYSLVIQKGDAEEIIPRQAREKNFITVVGPLGRPPLRRFLVGRSIHHLMAEIATPILYVPQARWPARKMLICLGGLGYEITAEHFALRVGVFTQAEVRLLHVIPPIDLDYPTARSVRQHGQDLVDTDTLPGRNLRRALEIARAAGLTANIRVRQGNVVEEILSEVREGDYDLVCMGSPYSAHGLRRLYTPNVTDEVAERIRCPLLTARYIPEPG